MNKIKNILKWIAGIITAIAGIFLLAKTFQDPDKKEFNHKKKGIEDDIKEVDVKKKLVATKKAATKKKIKESDTRIKATKSKLKDTKKSKDTLTDFKKKYKK